MVEEKVALPTMVVWLRLASMAVFRLSIDGIGFRRACVCTIRGTPWIARGSFIKDGSSLAGTVAERTARSEHR